MHGKFITFEGGEGTGKTTQISLLRQHLISRGKPVTVTREPGGTQLAESIRSLILDGKIKKFGAEAETILFNVARQDHLDKVIRPALEQGRWVLCDRFMDSTMAYQFNSGGVSENRIKELQDMVVGSTVPDMTIILDIEVERAFERVHKRQGKLDRFETMDLKFHQDLRQIFLHIGGAYPERCEIFDASQSINDLSDEVWDTVKYRYGL